MGSCIATSSPPTSLVTGKDHVYHIDFGLSKRVAADSEATRTGMVLGTLDYIAPEQIRGETIGPFTDVYSLGCMAYRDPATAARAAKSGRRDG
jgi:serine/threonine protein kinase